MALKLILIVLALLTTVQAKKCHPFVCSGNSITLSQSSSCQQLADVHSLSLSNLKALNKHHNCSLLFKTGRKVCLGSLKTLSSASTKHLTSSTASTVSSSTEISSTATASTTKIVIQSTASESTATTIITSSSTLITQQPSTSSSSTVQSVKPTPRPQAIVDCAGQWSSIGQCTGTCGESGTIMQKFIPINDSQSLCPSTRTIACTSEKCACPLTSTLVCTMKINNNNVIQCKMNVKPTSTAQFALTARGDLRIDTCFLNFNSSNYQIPQSITMNPIYNSPGFNNSTDISISYTATGRGEQFNNCTYTITSKRSVDVLLKAPGYCSINGYVIDDTINSSDPHVLLLSEKNYKPLSKQDIEDDMSMGLLVYGIGKFYAIKSNMGLTIQTQYGRCWGFTTNVFQPTCIIGIYIQYLDEFLSIQLIDNESSKKAIVRKSALNLISYTNDTNVFQIAIKDSPSKKIDLLSTKIQFTQYSHEMDEVFPNKTVKKWSMSYFGADINLSPIHYQQTQGHCNIFDYSPETRDPKNHVLFNGDTMYKAPFYNNAQIAREIYNWTTSFAVDANEDGFARTNTSISFSRFNTCPATQPLPVKLTRRSGLESNTTTSNSTSSSDSSLNIQESSITMSEAKAQCLACFGLNNPILVSMSHDALLSCASDIMAAGSTLFCGSHSQAATKNLLELALSSNSSTTTENQSSVSLALSNFYALVSTTSCVHGFKMNGVCICSNGYSGSDCSIVIASKIVFAAQVNQPTASASIGASMSFSVMVACLLFALLF